MDRIEVHAHLWLGHHEQDTRKLKAAATRYGLRKILISSLSRYQPSPEAVRQLNDVTFARLYPGIHGYDIRDVERLCRLLNQGSVSIEACAAMAQKFPEVRTVLSGFYLHELQALTLWPDNLWTDTSGLRHGPFEKHCDRTVFGSGFPMQCLERHLLNLSDRAKEQILSNSL